MLQSKVNGIIVMISPVPSKNCEIPDATAQNYLRKKVNKHAKKALNSKQHSESTTKLKRQIQRSIGLSAKRSFGLSAR